LGLDDGVSEFVVQRDGKVLIGGYFTTVNGVAAPGVARLWGNPNVPPVIKHVAETAGHVDVIWHTIPGRTYRVQYSNDLTAGQWIDVAGDVLATAERRARPT